MYDVQFVSVFFFKHFFLTCSLYLFMAVLGLHCGVQASHCGGFSHSGAWDSRMCRFQYLWCRGLVALGHVEYFWTRDGTPVPCISRRILNHWTTRKALSVVFDNQTNKNPETI